MPTLSVTFRYRAGMMMSVSMFSFGIGTTRLVNFVNASMPSSSLRNIRNSRCFPIHLRVRVSRNKRTPQFPRNKLATFLGEQLPHVGDFAGHRRRRRRQRTCEERPAALALPAFKIPVAGRNGVLARRNLVAVHGDA